MDTINRLLTFAVLALIAIVLALFLLNVDSAVAVLTQDRVRRVAGGFEILGRLPGAPPRGCSLAIDELLGRA